MTNKTQHLIKVKYLGLLLSFLLVNTILKAQPNNYFSNCGNLIAADNCIDLDALEAISLCEIDGFGTFNTGLTTDLSVETMGFCGTGTTVSNNMWVAFNANTTDILLEIEIESCQGVPAGTGGLLATVLQIDCNGGTSSTTMGDCQFCAPQTFQIGAQNLIIGDRYYIMIAGCQSDVCDFSINVLEGLPPAGFDLTLQASALCPPAQPGDNQEAFLVATVNPTDGNYTYEWTGPDGFIIPDATEPTYFATGVGEYSVEVRDENTCCPVEASALVLLADNPPIAVVAGSQQLQEINCSNPEVLLDATGSTSTGNVTYGWFSPNGSNLGNGIPNDSDNLTAIVDEVGTYTFAVFQNEFPFCLAETEVDVVGDFTTPIADAGLSQILSCNTTSVTLDASNSSGDIISYEWNGPSGFTSNQINPIVAQAGTYTLIVTAPNGCTSSEVVLINEDTNLPFADAGPSQTISCENVEVELAGSNSSAGNICYEWILPGGITSSQAIITADSPGTYTLIVTDKDNGCTSSDQVDITEDINIPSAIAQASNAVLTCTNPTATLDASASSTGADICYEWVGPNGFISNEIMITIDIAGTYLMTVTDKTSGCFSTSSVSVLENTNTPPDLPNLGTQTITCEITEIELPPLPPFYSYELVSPSGLSLTGDDIILPINNEAGTYTLVVTDPVSGCTNSATVDLEIANDIPIVNIGADTELTCSNPSLTICGQDNSNYTYTWIDEVGNSVGFVSCLDVTNTGTYTLIVTDITSGCTSSDDIVVSQASFPEVVVNCTPETMPDAFDGSAIATVSSGTPPYTYYWSNGVGEFTVIDDLEEGIYCLTLTDANGCSTVECCTVEVANDPIALTIISTDLACHGGADGSLEAIVEGGASPYLYLWSNGATTQTITNLMAGFYSVTITDSNGFTAESNFELSQPNPIDINVEFGNPDCEEGITLTATASGGIAPYNYSWSNGVDNQTVQISSGGDYMLTITDANGCEFIESITLDELPSNPDAIIQTPEILTCNINTVLLDGSASSSGANISYEWTDLFGAIISTESVVNVSQPGTYTLTVTDNSTGCSSEASVVVQEDINIPNINLPPDAELNCIKAGVSFTTNGLPDDNSYEWYDAEGNLLSTDFSYVFTIVGMYELVVTHVPTGCVNSDFIEITQSIDIPDVNTMGGTLTCIDTEITLQGSVDLSGGNYVIEWFTNDGNIISGGSILNPVVNEPGTYTLLVTNADNGCQASADALVLLDNEAPIIDTSPQDFFICPNSESPLMCIPVIGNYTYTWYDPVGNVISTNGCVTFTMAGDYTLEIVDGNNGCSTTVDYTINEDEQFPTITDIIEEDISCSGESDGFIAIELDLPSINYLFDWDSDGVGSIDGTDILTDVPAGTYNVTITSAVGCTTTTTIELTEPASLSLEVNCTSETSQTANDGSSEAIVSGGTSPYTYLWNDGQTTQSISNLSPDTYCVTITDNNGCIIEGCCTVNEAACNIASEITLLSNVSCNGANDGSLQVTVMSNSIPITYIWSSGATTDTAMNLPGGTYTVTATDALGCETISTATITEPDALSATLNEPIILSCTTSTIPEELELDLSGGTPPYEVGEVMFDISISQLSVIITDANDCEFLLIEQIEDDIEFPIVTASAQGIIDCANPSVILDATGSSVGDEYMLEWFFMNESIGNEIMVEVFSGGTYELVLTNIENGCTSSTFVEVLENFDSFSPTVSVNGIIDCNGEDVTLEVFTPSTDNLYEWFDMDGMSIGQSMTLEVDSPGVYSVIVTNVMNGCSSQVDVEVENHFIEINGLTTTIDCTGMILVGDVDVTGSHPPFNIIWTNDPSTQEIEITVIDDLGCTEIYTETIIVVPTDPLSATSTVQNDDGSGNGSIDLMVTGGDAPYEFLWDLNPGVATTEDIENLSAGEYSVTITDINGCELLQTFTIELNTAIQNINLANHINLFPNPTSGKLTLSIDSKVSNELQVELFDVMGRKLIDRADIILYNNQYQLNLEEYPSGVYLVKIRLENQAFTEKITLHR